MFGAIAGDIIGSIYEFKNIKTKDFPLFQSTNFFTDDTVCTVAIADALLRQTDPEETLRSWCLRYESNGGWGRKFSQWIVNSKLGPYGSYGNGAAMRISPIGFVSKNEYEAYDLADKFTAITHNHPEGIKGARATALTIFMARHHFSMNTIRNVITEYFQYDLSQSVEQIRSDYFFNETCQGTVPQALTCFLEATSFEDAIRNGISIGGDSDTIGSIVGGMAEAKWGIPNDILTEVRARLPDDMLETMDGFYNNLVQVNNL